MYRASEEPTDDTKPNRLTKSDFHEPCHPIFHLRIRTTSLSYEVIQTIIKTGSGVQLLNQLGYSVSNYD